MWETSANSKAILRLIEPRENKYLDYERIKSSLREQNGISSAKINLVAHTVKVEFDQNRITIEELQEVVKKACEVSIAGSAHPVSAEGKR